MWVDMLRMGRLDAGGITVNTKCTVSVNHQHPGAVGQRWPDSAYLGNQHRPTRGWMWETWAVSSVYPTEKRIK
jgi:hypothetical protein